MELLAEEVSFFNSDDNNTMLFRMLAPLTMLYPTDPGVLSNVFDDGSAGTQFIDSTGSPAYVWTVRSLPLRVLRHSRKTGWKLTGVHYCSAG